MVKTVFSGGEDMARIKNDFQMKVNWGFIRNMEMIDPSNSSSCALLWLGWLILVFCVGEYIIQSLLK